jgi:hypothetical protein
MIFEKIRKAIAISLLVCFVMSVTIAAVDAAPVFGNNGGKTGNAQLVNHGNSAGPAIHTNNGANSVSHPIYKPSVKKTPVYKHKSPVKKTPVYKHKSPVKKYKFPVKKTPVYKHKSPVKKYKFPVKKTPVKKFPFKLM